MLISVRGFLIYEFLPRPPGAGHGVLTVTIADLVMVASMVFLKCARLCFNDVLNGSAWDPIRQSTKCSALEKSGLYFNCLDLTGYAKRGMIMDELICEIWIMAFGSSAIWFVGRPERSRRWDYVLGLIFQPAWLYTAIQHKQFGIEQIKENESYREILGPSWGWNYYGSARRENSLIITPKIYVSVTA